jgi:spore coat protein CotH
MSYPRTDDTVVYDGTAVVDPGLTSDLPIIHWFMHDGDWQNALAHYLTDLEEPCVLFFDGRLYDRVTVRVRGQSSRSFPKKNWKFFLPQGHNFRAPGLTELSVDTFCLQGSYADKSYLREVLAWDTFRNARIPANEAFHVNVQKDGEFFGLYVYLEAPELTWAERNNLDKNAARYKAFDDMQYRDLAVLPDFYQKKSRLSEGYDDLHDLIRGVNGLSGPVAPFVYDNLDIPAVLNFLAVTTIVQNNDHLEKNYYLYRESEGTRRWEIHPWDLDLTFGRTFLETLLNDTIVADLDTVPGKPAYVSPSHPVFGTRDHRRYDEQFNHLIDAILGVPEIREMFYRRPTTWRQTWRSGLPIPCRRRMRRRSARW